MDDLQDRIDALGPDSSHLQGLRQVHLDRTLDPVLQQLVSEASLALDAPIALVSIVLDRIQYFRAHVGLEEPVSTARATDRDSSFCQFVVRDQQVFEVQDATRDPRVPQHLVTTNGIRAYLGSPIRSGDTVVGSFCVLDSRPRTFTPEHRATLESLARAAQERFSVLDQARVRTQLQVLEQSVRPTLPEIRDLLVPLTSNVQAARISVASLAPVIAMVDPATRRTFAQAYGAYSDLTEILDDMDLATRRLEGAVAGLESMLVDPDRPVELDDVVHNARQLARHPLKLVSSVRFEAIDDRRTLAIEGGTAIALLTTVLVAMAHVAAQATPSELLVTRLQPAPPMQVGLDIDVPGAVSTTVHELMAGLTTFGATDPRVAVEATNSGVRVRFSTRG